eukprot:2804487-Pyramimonas_sp.AAC.1
MQRSATNDIIMSLRVAEEVAALSMAEYSGYYPEICDSFAQHIAEDLELAERGESRHVSQEWKD